MKIAQFAIQGLNFRVCQEFDPEMFTVNLERIYGTFSVLNAQSACPHAQGYFKFIIN